MNYTTGKLAKSTENLMKCQMRATLTRFGIHYFLCTVLTTGNSFRGGYSGGRDSKASQSFNSPTLMLQCHQFNKKYSRCATSTAWVLKAVMCLNC